MADSRNSPKGSGKGWLKVGVKRLAPKTLNTIKSAVTKKGRK